MNNDPSTLQFIQEHANDDVRQLALAYSRTNAPTHSNIDMPFALDQIRGRQIARTKIPSWAALDDILYPPHLSMEQCSSEQTARYKAQLIARLFTQTNPTPPYPHTLAPTFSFADLTGGLGVDFSFILQAIKQMTPLPREGQRVGLYIERSPELCELAAHNFQALALQGVEVRCGDAIDLFSLQETDIRETAHIIFLDPARRNQHGARTYAISDCTPDVLALRDQLLARCHYLVLKLSPMLDWHDAVQQLGSVTEVHIVATQNECKELLLVLKGNLQELTPNEVPSFHKGGVRGGSCNFPPRIFCINDNQTFSYTPAPSAPSHLSTPAPSHLLYVPNAAINKAGCWSEVAEAYSVKPISANTHLFVSTEMVHNFPGRCFRIEQVCSLNKKEIKKALQGIKRANIATRNFPLTPQQLRQRLKLQDGGDTYIFGITSADEKHLLLVCSKASS